MDHVSPVRWELIHGVPDPRLAGVVGAYTGYREQAAAPVCRLEPPGHAVPLILSLGPSLTVDGARHTSFVAGPSDVSSITAYAGDQLGVELHLTLLGARRLLGMPLGEVARAVVSVADVLGPWGDVLVERLCAAPSWAARWALLDEALLRRLAATPSAAPEIVGAWQRLLRTGGAVPVAELVAASGWSRRHFTARFRAELGLPPKVMARILRFERVTTRLRAGGTEGLAAIAYDCGYADQAHLGRDFRALAGTTPTDYVRRLLPDGAGVAGGGVANVQDPGRATA